MQRRAYLLGGVFLLLTNTCALGIPWLMKLAVDSLRNPAWASHTASFYALLIVVAALLHGLVRVFSRTTVLHAGREIEYRIREDLYDRLLSLDLPYFSRERTGDIMSRFTNDLTNVRMLLGFGMMNVMNTAILYTAALVLMLRISPTLTVISLLPYVVMIVLVKRVSKLMFRRSTRVQEELAALTSRIEENVSAATVVRSYCREEAETETFRRSVESYFRENMKVAALRGVMIPIMGGAGGAGTLIVLFMGGSRVISGAMTLGDFVAFNGYLAMLIWPTVMMGWILNLMQRGAASMQRLNGVLEAKRSVLEAEEPVEREIGGEIEFRNLSCGYHEGEPLLKEITLTVKKGMRLGIVGPVGSGKSTLVRLIPRLYPAKEGELFIDGIDVNRYPLKRLRDAIGFVPQESFLFSRSIRENIAFGAETEAPERVEEAARIARLEGDVLRFPNGYETLVGERGVTLSGGQKQRVAIARALLKNPALLILDDPLSAVDASTEEEILAGLETYYAGHTVAIVSHRLSALRGCDLIVVLDNGRIVERGTNEELIAIGGRYAAIHREQQIRREISDL